MAAPNMTFHAGLRTAAGLCTAAACVALAGCGEGALQDRGTYAAKIAGQPFALTVSASDATRERGFGGATAIPDQGGMIFVFPDAQMRSFWMKDCLIDMDIVYCDPLGYITAIYTMTKEPPQSPTEDRVLYERRLRKYSSLAPAQYVIELRAGRAKELGLQPSQKIELDHAALRAAVQ